MIHHTLSISLVHFTSFKNRNKEGEVKKSTYTYGLLSACVLVLLLIGLLSTSLGPAKIANAQTCNGDQWSDYIGAYLYARTERCWSGSKLQDIAYSSQSSIVGTIRSYVLGWETGLNCPYQGYSMDTGYLSQYNATAPNELRDYQCSGNPSNPHIYHTSGEHYFLSGSVIKIFSFQ